MTRDELVRRMSMVGLSMAAKMLKTRTSSNQTSIIISDYDDEAYEYGLADFLQKNTKWRNFDNRDAFQAFFNDDSIKPTPEYGGLC